MRDDNTAKPLPETPDSQDTGTGGGSTTTKGSNQAMNTPFGAEEDEKSTGESDVRKPDETLGTPMGRRR